MKGGIKELLKCQIEILTGINDIDNIIHIEDYIRLCDVLTDINDEILRLKGKIKTEILISLNNKNKDEDLIKYDTDDF